MVKSSAPASMSAGAAATDVHKMDEFDFKILQQKRHEAEVKRCVSLCGSFTLMLSTCIVSSIIIILFGFCF